MRFGFRSAVILGALALGVFALYPTYRFYQLSPSERIADAQGLRKRAMHLGLDLQGGIHLVLGIDEQKFHSNLLANLKTRLGDHLRKEENLSVLSIEPTAEGLVVLLPAAAKGHDWSNLSRYFNNFGAPQETADPASAERIRVSFPLLPTQFDEEVRGASERAMEIIRNRIDYYGVKEPLIQMAGNDRIVVELAGATDPGAAKDLVGRTAQLEFHKVKPLDELVAALTAVDASVGGTLSPLFRAERNDQTKEVLAVFVEFDKRQAVEEILSSGAADAAAPSGTRISLGYEEENRRKEKIVPLYLIDREPAMTGEDLTNARPFPDPQTGRWAVSFEFGPQGAEAMGKLTGELLNGNKPLGIVVDGRVVSAPSVRSQIRDRGQITGRFDLEEAKRLAVMLKAGNLPAPIRIEEERTVGPSLGRDSIEKGIKAAGGGLVLVILFLIAYYRVGGVIGAVSLIYNLFLLVGILAGFGATLTLPGIAGIVLTMGMSVDANVLIYERIKEELHLGRPFRAAIEAGFARAFATILDSNLTTAIPGFFLYQFGTGPVKGFALTLLIGIATSIFSAVYVSRVIFDYAISRGAKRIPLGGGV